MKSIKYHWLWLEYRYLVKRVEHNLGYSDMLGKKLSSLKKDLEAMKTRLFFLEQDVKAGLEKE